MEQNKYINVNIEAISIQKKVVKIEGEEKWYVLDDNAAKYIDKLKKGSATIKLDNKNRIIFIKNEQKKIENNEENEEQEEENKEYITLEKTTQLPIQNKIFNEKQKNKLIVRQTCIERAFEIYKMHEHLYPNNESLTFQNADEIAKHFKDTKTTAKTTEQIITIAKQLEKYIWEET